MLPSRLLSFQRTGEGRIAPTWLTARDDVWLRELAAEAAASEGRRSDEANERIIELVGSVARRHGVGRRVVEAVWLVERRRWKTRVDSPLPPERIRQVVFELAAERPREEALATAARELALEPDVALGSLFADRARARRLVAPESQSSAAELSSAYNLTLAQALLARATEVVAVVRANVRAVVRYAKLLGLMTMFEEAPDGATRVTVSGPLALFHDTVKYGRALSRWFPSLVTTPGWSLEARVLAAGEPLLLALDGTAPLPRTHALPRASDSRLEARVERDVRALASPWRIVREAAVVHAGGRVFFPDFSLVCERGTVLVEVVGFWSPEYLEAKAALLRLASAPLLLCVDERHARGVLAEDPRVLPFRKKIDASRLVEACERLLAGHAPASRSACAVAPARRHYLVVPPSPPIREHAVAAGARAERWRADVLEDLTTGGVVRVFSLSPHPHWGRQLGIVGATLYAEANPLRDRDDGLFVHRVTRLANRKPGAAGERAAAFELLETGAVRTAPRLDAIEHLFPEVPASALRG